MILDFASRNQNVFRKTVAVIAWFEMWAGGPHPARTRQKRGEVTPPTSATVQLEVLQLTELQTILQRGSAARRTCLQLWRRPERFAPYGLCSFARPVIQRAQ